MKSSQHESLIEARLLLPWYSQGLLEQEQMDWMKIQIETYPELLEEYTVIQTESDWLQQQIKLVDKEEYKHDPQRLDNLLANIRQNEKSSKTSASLVRIPFYSVYIKNYINKIKQFLFPSSEVGLWKASASVALLIITVQSGLLVQNYFSEPNTEYTTLSGESTLSVQDERVLLVSFQAKTTLQQVQSLLIKHQLSFIQGPDAAGLYLIRIPENITQDVLIKILEAESHIIQFVEKP